MADHRTATLAVAALTLGLTVSAAGAAEPKSAPAPWGALTSADKAMAIAFDQVCLPAMLDGKPIADLARFHHMTEVNPKLNGATAADRVWRLASLGKVLVVAWADGTCSSSSERGEPEALSKAVRAAVEGKGITLTAGQVDTARANGRRIAYCSSEVPPLVLAITTRTAPRDKREAILTTVFRAKGAAPAFCRPS